jgi:hypothetical protein
MGRVLAFAIVSVVLGAAGLGWAVSELQDGLTEVPQHWWSTLATLPLLLGVGILCLAGLGRARS